MNITFRGMCITDLEFFNEVRNSCAEKYLHDSRKFTLEQTQQWFLHTSNVYFIIENNGVRIGYFRSSNFSEVNKNIYIGADLHEDYRGKGFGYVAYKLFINFLFDHMDLRKMSLEVIETNGIAIRLYQKLGFVEEGRKREDVKRGGLYFDSVIMSLLKKEWKKRYVA